jgi:hypothetical protein
MVLTWAERLGAFAEPSRVSCADVGLTLRRRLPRALRVGVHAAPYDAVALLSLPLPLWPLLPLLNIWLLLAKACMGAEGDAARS